MKLAIEKVLHGNCLELMLEIAPKSVDLIVCDLPYGVTRASWDKPLPFKSLWKCYKRIIKDTGVIALTATQPFTSEVVMSNKPWFREEIIWEKTLATGGLNSQNQHMRCHESVLIFYKKRGTFNPQITEGHELKQTTRRTKGSEIYNKDSKVTSYSSTSRYPRSVLKMPSDVRQLRIGADKRPATVKPVALIDYIVKTYSNKGDLILDNCAGSGTSAVVAIKTYRNYIIMEKKKEFYKGILERLKDVQQELPF